MIGRVARLRVALGLDGEKPLVFLAQANAIYTGLTTNPTLFVTPDPSLSVMVGQIQDATTAQQSVGKVKGAAAVRDAKFQILVTTLESQRMMVQALCDASPEQAATLIAAAAMKSTAIRAHAKPVLALKNALPSGTVLLDANGSLLDGTSRRKIYNWQSTIDGGKSFFPLPSTPTAKTSVANLTPLTMVGLQVAVTVHKQPQGPWSQTVSILVR